MWDKYRDPDREPDATLTTFDLEVDGERFRVEVSVNDDTGYTNAGYIWLSGPNEGYGFGIGGPPILSMDSHREQIRNFLSMVDPDTGFIADD